MMALRFLPPLCWTALIAWLSSSDWSADRTGAVLSPVLQALLPWATPEQIEAVHWLARKIGHVVEYAVLAGLWRRALAAPGTRSGWRVAFGLSALTACLDELHQATAPGRSGSAIDIVLDAASAASALALLHVGTRAATEWLAGALLWVAAAGGTTLILLHWAASTPAGWLWWSVPTAWIVLLFWHRRRSRQ